MLGNFDKNIQIFSGADATENIEILVFLNSSFSSSAIRKWPGYFYPKNNTTVIQEIKHATDKFDTENLQIFGLQIFGFIKTWVHNR